MNRTVVFVTFAVLAGLALCGFVLLEVSTTEDSAPFSAFVIQILGMVTLAAGTFYGLGSLTKKVDEVHRQTNGNLSRRDAKIELQAEEIAELKDRLAEKHNHEREGV